MRNDSKSSFVKGIYNHLCILRYCMTCPFVGEGNGWRGQSFGFSPGNYAKRHCIHLLNSIFVIGSHKIESTQIMDRQQDSNLECLAAN